MNETMNDEHSQKVIQSFVIISPLIWYHMDGASSVAEEILSSEDVS